MKHIASGIVITLLVGAAIFSFARESLTQTTTPKGTPGGNVAIVDGKQVITIRAKNGYWPQRSTAKSGMPTVLRFETDATYDCSSTISIPGKKISASLPPSGFKDFDVGVLTPGLLQGTCGMGMFQFSVDAAGT